MSISPFATTKFEDLSKPEFWREVRKAIHEIEPVFDAVTMVVRREPSATRITVRGIVEGKVYRFEHAYRMTEFIETFSGQSVYSVARYFASKLRVEILTSGGIKEDKENMPYKTTDISSAITRCYRIKPDELPTIEKVIFNGPCTIVLWSDKTKTIVKCQDGDDFDREKGLTMAVAKKFLGTNDSHSNYCDVIKKWTEVE